MRTPSFIILLLICTICCAQQTLTTEQINRLADAGKVYGYIKYFHPYLQYKTLNWDSVFAANVEGIIRAKNREEYAEAMQGMLSALNDDLTGVANMHKGNPSHQPKPTAWHIKDSLLYISINDANDDSNGIVGQAFQNISKVKGVILDMRVTSDKKLDTQPPTGVIDWSDPLFFKGDILLPSSRRPSYQGLYEAYFRQGKVSINKGTATKDVPLVFIVESDEQVPLRAMALQQKGAAAIIQPAGKELALGGGISFYIQDSVIVNMRVSEAVRADGSLAQIYPDATYSPTDSQDVPIHLAEQMITKGFKKYSNVSKAAPQALEQEMKRGNEKNYPSLGYRMLAAAKIFSAIDNFFPDKDLMDKDWEECYRSSISKFIAARDSVEYLRAIAELYANTSDSHGFITRGPFNLELNPIIQGRGSFIPPVITDVIENKVVVSRIYDDTVCKRIGLREGDEIVSIDGQDPLKMIGAARKYQSASTKASQTFFVSKFILFGAKGQIKKLKVRNTDGKIRLVDMPSLRAYGSGDFFNDPYNMNIYCRHTKGYFRLLTKDIGYADLTSPMTAKDVDSMFEAFKNTKAIIFDDRGYPHFDAGKNFDWKLAKNQVGDNAIFAVSAPTSPNVKVIGWPQYNFKETFTESQNLTDWIKTYSTGGWVYKGKIIMLINESAQSWGEHICLTMKALCNAFFIGSATSGTNGGLAAFTVPGNVTLWLSGGRVAWPDGTRTQRVGIKPDITVYPTIKGIQAGKDEVLDRAVRYINTGK
jgi:C-terminal processing protease CtpA/Prc